MIVSSCNTPQSFEYRELKNFVLTSRGLDQTNASMDLIFFNPNKYSINLKNVNCDIFLENNLIGKFTLDTTMHIPAASLFTLPAKMKVDAKSLLKNNLNLLLNKEILIAAKGTTKVGKGGFYITLPFSYQGKQKLNLF